MIHIAEQRLENQILIIVEGRLDRDALSTFKKVCDAHLKSDEALDVVIQLEKLQGTCFEAKNYLKQISKKVYLKSIPEFLEMELFSQ